MKAKKLTAILLAAATVTGMCACGDSADMTTVPEAGKEESKTESEYTKIVYAYGSYNNIPEDLSDVEEAINQISREKIGVEVSLMPISMSNYSQQVSLALQGGDQIDLFHSTGDYGSLVASKMAYDITDLMEEHAKETLDIVGERMMKTVQCEGRIYGIPAYKGVALAPLCLYRKDITDELGIDMSQVTSLEDLGGVYEQVLQAYPDMTPLVPVSSGDTGLMTTLYGIDYLGEDCASATGVLVGDSMTVENLYETQFFADLCATAREWYEAGYILKDAVTTTSNAGELITAGTGFSYIAAYSGAVDGVAKFISTAAGGKDIGGIRITPPYLSTSATNLNTWMVSSTCKNPEAALEFLNLTYTDIDLINLIIYGIEGRDYVKVDEDTVTWPEGLDSQTVPYTAQLSSGLCGNQFIHYVMEGTTKEDYLFAEEENKTAETSKAFGFIFDRSNVKTEYTAVNNVINQYLPGLRCGSLDPESALPEFLEKLKEAGIDKIIEEKQNQLDAWAANNE